jgi:hypothetical protein
VARAVSAIGRNLASAIPFPRLSLARGRMDARFVDGSGAGVPIGTCGRSPAVDGTWNVAIQTKAGSCDPTANYTVTVTEGKVSGPANVSGTVGPSGNVRVSIGAAYASGQLEAAGGPANGTLPVAECRAAVAGRLQKNDALLSLRCPAMGLGHQTIDDGEGCVAEAECDYHAHHDLVAVKCEIRPHHCLPPSPTARP